MLGWTLIPSAVGDVVLFVALGSLAALVFSMAKAGFGGSAGILAVPLMIYACGGNTDLARGILLPMLIAADWPAVVAWRWRWDIRQVGRLLPGALVGIALGWAAMWALRELEEASRRQVYDAAVKLGVGLIALAFVGMQVARTLRHRPIVVRPGAAQAALVGALAGFTSTFSHAAGPVVAMFMLSLGLNRGVYVATTALFFFLANHIKLVPYVQLGMLDIEALSACIVFLPAIAAGAALGVVLHRRVSDRVFLGVVYVLLTAAGADLCRKAVATLLG